MNFVLPETPERRVTMLFLTAFVNGGAVSRGFSCMTLRGYGTISVVLRKW